MLLYIDEGERHKMSEKKRERERGGGLKEWTKKNVTLVEELKQDQ